jgi:hypothetical protein
MIAPGTYLLYDVRCPRCSKLAEKLEEAFQGKLRLADLRDRKTRRILDSARPAWRFEPTLVTVDAEGQVRVATGLRLRLDVIRVLGVRRSIRSLLIAREFRVPAIGIGPLGVRPHPATSPEEIEAVDVDTRVRVQPDVRVEISSQEGKLRLSYRDREIVLPGHVAGEVEFILQQQTSPFSVAEITGQLDPPSRIDLIKMLLLERMLVTCDPIKIKPEAGAGSEIASAA